MRLPVASQLDRQEPGRQAGEWGQTDRPTDRQRVRPIGSGGAHLGVRRQGVEKPTAPVPVGLPRNGGDRALQLDAAVDQRCDRQQELRAEDATACSARQRALRLKRPERRLPLMNGAGCMRKVTATPAGAGRSKSGSVVPHCSERDGQTGPKFGGSNCSSRCRNSGACCTEHGR
jgi:hypothetical protein